MENKDFDPEYELFKDKYAQGKGYRGWLHMVVHFGFGLAEEEKKVRAQYEAQKGRKKKNKYKGSIGLWRVAFEMLETKIFIAVLLYPLGVLIGASFNPFSWNWGVRLLYALCVLSYVVTWLGKRTDLK